MAVVSVEKRETTESTFRFDLNEQVDEYIAITDDLADGPAQILADPACPEPGDPLAGAPAFICREVEIDQMEDNGLIWEVTARYDNQALVFVDPNPLNRPALYSFTFTQYERELYRGIGPFPDPPTNPDPFLIQNSAGQLFEPPVTIPYYDLQITVTKNEATYNASSKVAIINRQNSVAWTNAPEVGTIGPGQGLITGISGTPQTENGIEFYQVQYTISVREDTWELDVRDEGTVELNDDMPPKQIAIVIPDPNGRDVEVDQVWPLDGSGKAIREPGKTVQLNWQAYETTDFNLVIPT